MRNIFNYLVVRYKGNMTVKFDSNWPNDIGGAVIFFLFLALVAILFIDVEQF